MCRLRRAIWCCAFLFAAATADAQVQTGSIVGLVTDSSNSVLPGVNIVVTSDRLIGGTQTTVTDANGTYRLDRLPPGDYHVKFELQGFKVVTRADIRLSAAFWPRSTPNSKSVISARPSPSSASRQRSTRNPTCSRR